MVSSSSRLARKRGSRTQPRRQTVQRARARASQPPDHRRMHEAAWSRADAIAVLEAPERRRSQSPDLLWRRVGLKEGDTLLDVGAGSGFYSFPASRRVGPTGRVVAVDVSSELVELIRERARRDGVPNVESLLSAPNRIPLEDATADVALLANVLHGIPPKTVSETVRVLRPGGRLVDVDWKKVASAEGPPLHHRLSVPEARAALAAYGLTPVDAFDLGPTHYVLVFERPRPTHLPGHLVSAE
jgi:SAM-dependent methyltransferase